jgi:hypothetical protein
MNMMVEVETNKNNERSECEYVLNSPHCMYYIVL